MPLMPAPTPRGETVWDIRYIRKGDPDAELRQIVFLSQGEAEKFLRDEHRDIDVQGVRSANIAAEIWRQWAWVEDEPKRPEPKVSHGV